MYGLSVRPSVTRFLMSGFLCENHRGSPTLASLNVLGVLGVLGVLHGLPVLHVLHVLNMPMDASLACWALFSSCLVQSNTIGMPQQQQSNFDSNFGRRLRRGR